MTYGNVWGCRPPLHPCSGVLHPGMLPPTPCTAIIVMLAILADIPPTLYVQSPADLLTGNAAAAPYGNANGYITGGCTLDLLVTFTFLGLAC